MFIDKFGRSEFINLLMKMSEGSSLDIKNMRIANMGRPVEEKEEEEKEIVATTKQYVDEMERKIQSKLTFLNLKVEEFEEYYQSNKDNISSADIEMNIRKLLKDYDENLKQHFMKITDKLNEEIVEQKSTIGNIYFALKTDENIIEGNEKKINELNTQLSEFNSNIKEDEQNITAHFLEITDHKQILNSLKEKIKTIEESIAFTNLTLHEKVDKISENYAAINENKENLKDHTDQLLVLTSLFNEINNKLNLFEASVNSANVFIDNIESTLKRNIINILSQEFNEFISKFKKISEEMNKFINTFDITKPILLDLREILKRRFDDIESKINANKIDIEYLSKKKKRPKGSSGGGRSEN